MANISVREGNVKIEGTGEEVLAMSFTLLTAIANMFEMEFSDLMDVYTVINEDRKEMSENGNI